MTSSVFNEIYNCRSLTVIDHLVQDEIENGASYQDLELLNKIASMTSLDDIWVLALIGAGRVTDAMNLQIEIDEFKVRKAARSF